MTHSQDPVPEPRRQPAESDDSFALDTVVTAVYDHADDARNAVQELINSGIARENVSVVTANTIAEQEEPSPSGQPVARDGLSAGQGALVGGVGGLLVGGIGGLLVGLASLTLPGIGPILAAGPIAAAIIGAGAGAATGGLFGALTGMGLNREDAAYYAEAIRRGAVLVTVQTDETATDRVIASLDRHHPVDIEQRANEWHQAGWTGYDPDAAPYDPETVSEVRDRQAGSGPNELERTVARH